MRAHGYLRNAEQEGPRKALKFWNNLFLVFIPRFCVLCLADCCPLVGGLSSLFYWIDFICFGVLGQKGDAPSAQFCSTCHRNGGILYFAFDRLLCRQRQELAVLEPVSTNRVLDNAERNWRTDYRFRLVAAPPNPTDVHFGSLTAILRRKEACPLWVKSRHMRRNKSCPLYPQKQTCAVQLGMSAMGQ